MPGKIPAEVEALLAGFNSSVQDTARALRETILRLAPGLTEMPDAKARVIGYGFGTGYKGLVCTIILSKNGVKLGLVGSADWPDPDALLEGTGKKHRYAVCDSAESTHTPALVALLRRGLERHST